MQLESAVQRLEGVEVEGFTSPVQDNDVEATAHDGEDDERGEARTERQAKHEAEYAEAPTRGGTDDGVTASERCDAERPPEN